MITMITVINVITVPLTLLWSSQLRLAGLKTVPGPQLLRRALPEMQRKNTEQSGDSIDT